MIYRTVVKPFCDVFFATLAFIVLFPVFMVIALLLVIINSGNPFFTQVRPGRNEKQFRLIKFKTMTDRKDATGQLLPDAERLTRAGAFIRKTSLDEIPQLLNVMMGDMSLVGPRPLLVEYLILYNDTERQRHLVRPGISGWAQVNGRNAISWPQKFAYDVWYVQHQSFFLDFKILIQTLGKVFRSEGIAQQGQATMEKFTGSTTSLHP